MAALVAKTWARDADLNGGTEIAFIVDCRDMANSDWLSIEEISRLWGEETGLDAAAFKKDLEEWFAEFVKQSPTSQSLITGKSTDTTNRLMGMLGARYLERPTFEAYCEERGHPKPQFWFGGRLEGTRRDEPSQPEPVEAPPQATPPPPGEDRSHVGQASDPELAAFQTQIAGMSERLKTPSFDVPGFSKPSAAGQNDLASDREQWGPPTEQNQQELIERAEADSAVARQLKTQLEAAEQRIADLSEAAASDASPPHASTTSLPPERQVSANYRDPSDTGRMLRQATRQKGRGRAVLAAGLAVPAVAVVALLYWGAVTTMQPTGNEESPTTPETAAPSSEPATGQLDLGGDAPPDGAQDLVAAQRQIARLTAALQASDTVAARLRDELAIARQAVEAARQTGSADADEKLAGLGTQLESALGAAADADTRAARARAEATHLRTALQQAKENDAKRQDLTLPATVSSARLAALQRELDSARQQIAELGRANDVADADTAGLRASLRQAEEQAEAVRQELTLEVTTSSARLATQQKELRAAQLRIADLSKVAEEEAVKLREELADLQQEAAATGSSSVPGVESQAPEQKQRAVEGAAEPDVEEMLSAVKNPPEPGSGGFEQVATLASAEAALQTDAVPDTVSPNDLLLEPERHLDQEVVVTGSVVWLLWRYRLQSDSGSDSMVIDVEGLRSANQEALEEAIDRVGVLGQVHARIRGTIVHQGEESYRLAASELVLVE
jgi:hypothetical protein